MSERHAQTSSRAGFPRDLLALTIQPLIIGAIALAMGSLFPIIGAVRHPSPTGFFLTFCIAAAASVVGVACLFFAKLPQYRAGRFWQTGSRHLPPRHQRLYRLAFLLIVPSCLALLVLIALADRVR